MKYTLSFLFSMLVLSAFAQEVYQFNPEFKENSTYKTNMVMSTSAKVLEGPEQMKAMEATMGNKMTMDLSMTTSSANTIGKTPFQIKYDKMETVSPMMPDGIPGMDDILKDVVIHGTVTEGIKLEVDSISGGDNPIMNNALSQGVQQMTQSIEFPKDGMKIGDSFEQDLSKTGALAAQMPGSTMTATYTLTKVEGDMAYFDYAISMQGTMGGIMTMTGEGKGVSTYDLSHNYMTGMNGVITMTMDGEQGGETMKMEMVVDQKMSITLE